MAILTRTASSLRSEGPVVEIELATPETLADARGVTSVRAPAIRILAMIDIGATTTTIRAGLAQQLGLTPIRETRITTPTSVNVPCYQYRVLLTFADVPVSFPELVVTEAPLEGQHIECLIGRDILMDAVLIYNGPDNSFTLSF